MIWSNTPLHVIFQIQESLVLAESRLSEARKQYDLMFESKQAELSKHLKEISQRNDQVLILKILFTG